MRNLDAINPSIAKPKSLGSIGALVPLILSASCVTLADGAAPHIPFNQNPLSIFCLGVVILSLLFLFIPRIFNWGWQAKYFGIPLFYVGSLALVGWIPILCIVLYGKLPLWFTLAYLGINIGLTYWWCNRFIIIFKNIYDDPKLHNCLYVEEQDAVYYMQKGDVWLLEKKFKFSQFPSNIFLISAMIIAFLLVPFMGVLTQLIGVPFTHIFLAVALVPINLFALGFTTKSILGFYYYPWKIKRQTGKDVYVDMASTSPSCKNTPRN